MIPAIWNYFVGYAVGTAIAVIGLYIAFILPVYPALPAGRQLGRAAGVEPRQALQVDRHRSRSSGSRSSRSSSSFPLVQGRAPVEGRLQLGVHELHDPLVRGHRPRLRRLVGRSRRRTGSRARCAWAPRRSSSGWRRRQLGEFELPTEAVRVAESSSRSMRGAPRRRPSSFRPRAPRGTPARRPFARSRSKCSARVGREVEVELRDGAPARRPTSPRGSRT